VKEKYTQTVKDKSTQLEKDKRHANKERKRHDRERNTEINKFSLRKRKTHRQRKGETQTEKERIQLIFFILSALWRQFHTLAAQVPLMFAYILVSPQQAIASARQFFRVSVTGDKDHLFLILDEVACVETINIFKGTVAWDFRALIFFMNR